LGAEALRAKAAGVDRSVFSSTHSRCPLPTPASSAGQALPREISRGRDASRTRRAGGGMILAGYGVDRPNSVSRAVSSVSNKKVNHRDHRVHREASFDRLGSGKKIPFSVPSVPSSSSVSKPSLAGHGVDRPDSKFHPLSSAHTTQTAYRPSSRRDHLRYQAFIGGQNPSLAGYGVDRPDSSFQPPAAPACVRARPSLCSRPALPTHRLALAAMS
jgi:hypothetical protein